jgi:L-threonylcarbamoyladenylate synthase
MTIQKDSPQTRQLARSAISRGRVIAFLTDTFYGLGADPFNREALRQIYALKGREAGKPILVVLSDRAEAERFVLGRTELFEAVSQKHWPGALTLIVKARQEVPEEITGGSGTVGLRLPADESVREFVRSCGGALTATSANPSGQGPARTAAEVESYFPQLLDLIVDGGAAQSLAPSTVLDTSGEKPRLIREGALSIRQLRDTLRLFGSTI